MYGLNIFFRPQDTHKNITTNKATNDNRYPIASPFVLTLLFNSILRLPEPPWTSLELAPNLMTSDNSNSVNVQQKLRLMTSACTQQARRRLA